MFFLRKKIFIFFIAVMIVVVLLPAALVGILRWPRESELKLTGPAIKVYYHERDVIEETALEQYLVGVLAAEMPASFEEEALKAQAVAARTYALKKIENSRQKPDANHPGADICTNPNHCQAWMTTEEMQSRWGVLHYIRYLNKIKKAVAATYGQVLTFDGKLIDPVYHANSGGRTENSESVWKYKIPYLRSVESPWDTEAPHWKDTKSFTPQELERRLETKISASKQLELNISGRTESGRAAVVKIGGKSFTGSELRKLLELKSTYLNWDVKEGKLFIETKGNGHGVGLSQYGANGMAREKFGYIDILKHYYTGVKLEQANYAKKQRN